MRILLQPAAGKEAMEHFSDTIENGVLLDSFRDKVDGEVADKLQKLPVEHLQVWGIVPNNDSSARNEWLQLEAGDLILFYKNKSFYYLAKVYLKLHNPQLADMWWGRDSNGRTWEYIYFIEAGRQIDLPYQPTVIGYKENHIVRGAVLLNEQQSENLKHYVDSREGEVLIEQVEPTATDEKTISARIRQPRTSDEAISIIQNLSQEVAGHPVTERIKTAKVLVRNPRFARLVKEKSKYICEICDQKPFIQKSGVPYAEAHHIEELARARIDNPSKMICVCPMCHRVLHYGSNEALAERTALKNT